MKRYNKIANPLIQNLLIMLINPLIAVIVSAINALKSNRHASILIFAIIVALYASVINITKVPVSDQVNYLEQFNNVDKVGFIQTLMYGGAGSIKEPIYGIYVYVTHYLFLGNAKLFFLLTSFLSLFFHYIAMINIAKKYRYPNYIVITGIVVLTFFTPFYSLTLHVIRQILATGIAFYAISLKMLDEGNYRKYLPWMIIAVLTHSTSILLVLLAFLPYINKEFKFKRLIGFVVVTAIFAFTFPKVSENLLGGSDNSNFMTYAMSRAQTAEGLSDNADGTNMSKSILYIVSIPLILSSLYSYCKKRKDVSPIFTNLSIMMCIFVYSVSYSPLIQYRYFFVLYSFMLFTIPLIFKVSTSTSKSFCFALSIFIIIYFLSTYSKNYDYAKVPEIITSPFPFYFTINPY